MPTPQTISVSAQKRWVDTAVDLTAGDALSLTASGQWTNGGQPAYYAGPEGFAGVTYDKAVLPSANFIALIGKVGDQGEPFFVGGAYTGTSPGTGRLYLQINDEDNDVAFADNRGEMVVEITSQLPRPSWSSATGQDCYGRWVDITVPQRLGTGTPVIQRLRWIPPGHFLMGSPETEPERVGDKGRQHDGPQHEVTISKGFWLFETACTQALWQAVMGGNPSAFKSPDRPVENVSWDYIQGFLGRINQMIAGLDLDLPTEAQWEYACRAGTVTPFSFGANITPEQVNYHGDYPYAGGQKGRYRGETVPVASLPPNPWGLFEMHGNVAEWCRDDLRQYRAQPETDPQGPLQAGVWRVLRGGSWSLNAGCVRSAHRNSLNPNYCGSGAGFRCARVPS